jgi:UDP-2,3-diacylglucosamine pyrophosphatase LpxH
MSAPCFDTVILSDLHLGSEVSRAQAALAMLQESCFRRLILLGDIFCDLNFRRLKNEHWKFLSYIRKLSNPKRRVEVVWVEGNHDQGLSQVMSHLVGVEVYEEHEWSFRGIRHLAIHGHQFDRFTINNLALSRCLTTFFLALQKLDSRRQDAVRLLERLDTKWLRLTSKVANGALAHARARQVQRVFCGHTHEPMRREEDGIEYFNTGCWTQPRATYVTIDEEGVQLREYCERIDNCYPGEERGDSVAEAVDFADRAGLPEDSEYESVPG